MTQPAGAPSGDDHFAELVAAEHDRALRLAALLAGDRAAAEDAFAEAFARTYEKWRAGRVDAVGPYLRRAVVNQVKNQRRSLARLRTFEQRRAGDDRGAASVGDRIADADAVVRWLSDLPYRQRAALVLRFYEDCTEREVAEALGCRPGTAKSLVSRGLAALRERARAEGVDEGAAAGLGAGAAGSTGPSDDPGQADAPDPSDPATTSRPRRDRRGRA